MEGMKRPNMVSFLDWTNKFDDYSGLKEKNGEGDGDLAKRTRSGMNGLSAYGKESDCSGDDLKWRFGDGGPGKLRLSQYKDVIPQSNGQLGAQIYDKNQRTWMRTFNQEEDAYDIAGLKFRGIHHAVTNLKPAEGGHPQNRFLSEGEMVDMLQKHNQLDHSKITTPTVAGRVTSGVDRVDAHVKLEEAKEVKPGEGVEKSESASEKDKSGREHMFDKAVTPSDVGKLNRLVIPKQHAEKYFPLDTNANEKGLLLNFEDNTGKTWKFRYSYWNSSQSYVLTKGWSRFVKEKKLDAGDIVSFERGTNAQNVERLFITWRRRPCAFQPSKAALLRGLSLPSLSTTPSFQYSPFQSHGLNIGKLGQAHHVKSFPEWMSVVWSANNGGAPSRAPAMWAEQMHSRQLQPISVDRRFHPAEVQNSAREPLDFMQLKTPPGDRSWPIEKPTVKSSKKGVRLFGVNL